MPSILAPKKRSQQSLQGFAGFGVQEQKSVQQNSQAKRTTRSVIDQGEANRDDCAASTLFGGSILVRLAQQALKIPEIKSRNFWELEFRRFGSRGLPDLFQTIAIGGEQSLKRRGEALRRLGSPMIENESVRAFDKELTEAVEL